MKTKHFTKFTSLTCLTAIFLFKISYANAGGLMVVPSIVNLNEKKSSQEVKLVNKGNETTTYRVSLQNLRMNKDGSYTEVNGVDEKLNSAEDLVRYSPKQVTLKPNEVQTIRLMFKKTDEIADGEYRSHLLMREEAPAEVGKNIEEEVTGKKNKKISVVLKPLFGVSIPVIITKGAVSSTVEIKEVTKSKDGKSLLIKLSRLGNASIFGDLSAILTEKNTNKVYDIGTLGGVSVLYPSEERSVSMPINLPKGVSLSGAKIDVNFYGKKEKEGEGLVTDREKVLSTKTAK